MTPDEIPDAGPLGRHQRIECPSCERNRVWHTRRNQWECMWCDWTDELRRTRQQRITQATERWRGAQ